MASYWLVGTNRRLHDQYAWALVATACVAVVALFASLQTAFLILMLTIFAWWVWLTPVAGFFLLLVVSPLLPMLKVTQSLGSITLLKDVIILTLAMRLVVVPLLQQQLPYRRNILFAPLVVLAAWVTQALFRADAAILGVLRAREIILYAILYLAVLYLPTSQRFYKELAGWLASIFSAIAILAVFQWVFARDSAVLRFDPARQIWIPRISSTFGHPSVYGEYLIAFASLCVAYLASFPRRVPALWLGVAFLITLPLIYLTYSRAVWVGFAGAIVIMLAVAGLARIRQEGGRLPWKHGLTIIVLGVVLLLTLFRFTQVGVFLSSAFDSQYRSNQVRLEFLARLLAPTTNLEAFIGRGLGDVTAQNFRDVQLRGVDIATTASRTIQLAKNSTLVDNQYLKTFIELGLFGLLIYAWILIRILRASFTLATLPKHAPHRAIRHTIGLASLGFMTAFVIQALFIDIWDVFPTNMLFWIVAGVVSTATITPIKKVTGAR